MTFGQSTYLLVFHLFWRSRRVGASIKVPHWLLHSSHLFWRVVTFNLYFIPLQVWHLAANVMTFGLAASTMAVGICSWHMFMVKEIKSWFY
jgi:hypothetical protein